MDIQAKINGLKERLHSTLTKDSTPEQIKEVEAREKELDELATEYDKVVKEKQEVTDLYIKASKNQGSKDAPSEEEKQPRSLEEIANEEINKGKK